MYLFWKTLIALLLIDKASVEVLKEYVKYVDIFFEEAVTKLLAYIGLTISQST